MGIIDFKPTHIKVAFFPLVAIVLAFTGCNQKSDVSSGVSKLEEAFPAASAATPGVTNSPEEATKQAPVDAYVGQAMSSLQKGEHVEAVTLLSTVRRQPGLTAQQHMAIHQTIQSVSADLAARAAKGDPKAKAAMAELEKKMSQ